MRSDTQSIDVNAAAGRVFAFISDARTLPLWTVGFISSVAESEGGWQVLTARGPAFWRIKASAELGTVDFYTSPPFPERPTYARVLAFGDSSALIFTMFQWPELTDERFSAMRPVLAAELQAIKQIVETGWPIETPPADRA